jgi:hypothetical protein
MAAAEKKRALAAGGGPPYKKIDTKKVAQTRSRMPEELIGCDDVVGERTSVADLTCDAAARRKTSSLATAAPRASTSAASQPLSPEGAARAADLRAESHLRAANLTGGALDSAAVLIDEPCNAGVEAHCSVSFLQDKLGKSGGLHAVGASTQ